MPEPRDTIPAVRVGRASVTSPEDLPRDALRAFATDLGAERALVTETDATGTSVLLEVAAGGESPPARPALGWASADALEVVPEDRLLRVPLQAAAGHDLAVTAVFPSPELRGMSFVPIAVRRLAPLLTACLGLWLRGRAEQARAAGLELAANLSGLGLLLLDPDGRLRFANRRAEQLMAAGDGLRRQGDTIAATTLKDAVALRAAIGRTTDHPAAPAVVRLNRPGDRRPLIVTVTRQGEQAGSRHATVVHLLDPELETGELIEPFCRLYRLSAMEGALAAALANGSSLAEAAATLGLKVQTARSYLKHIFVKTDVRRQSELIRLILLSSTTALEDASRDRGTRSLRIPTLKAG